MQTSRASNMDVRRLNRNRIYRLIHAREGISRPEIAATLGMSLPTVSQNVKTLMEQGLVEESGNLESTGGRKAAALAAVASARQALGVDITRNHVVAALVAMDGGVTASCRTRLPFADTPDYLRRVAAIAGGVVEEAGVEPETIVGAGISIPGVLSPDNASLVMSHVLQLRHYSFAGLDAALGLPAVHVNDANAAAIAELWGAESDRPFVYLSLSNSVGGALLLGGRPRPGDNGRCGEIGHITMDPDGPACYCGKRGCLDVYCAASLLADRTGGDLAAFFQAVEAGDPALTAMWDSYLDRLATAVNSLRMIFDCDIVIGGYVGGHMEPHIEDLRKRAAIRNTFGDSGEYIRLCRRKTEASAVGAALVHIGACIETI